MKGTQPKIAVSLFLDPYITGNHILLAQRAGINLPEAEYSEEAKKRDSQRARLLEVNKEAAKYFYYQLRGKSLIKDHCFRRV